MSVQPITTEAFAHRTLRKLERYHPLGIGCEHLSAVCQSLNIASEDIVGVYDNRETNGVAKYDQFHAIVVMDDAIVICNEREIRKIRFCEIDRISSSKEIESCKNLVITTSDGAVINIEIVGCYEDGCDSFVFERFLKYFKK